MAFTTHVGLFEPVVMFFGMTNSSTTFQRMMNEIMRNLINERKVAVFVNRHGRERRIVENIWSWTIIESISKQ